MGENERYELMAKVAALEAKVSSIERWQEQQDERINKNEEQLIAKVQKLEDKIDKIIDNERQLLETINSTDASLDEKIDERFNKIQMWLLGTATTLAISLLTYVLEHIIK
ncbi:MAG: hypothetical protein K0R18_61 [Bacillales bacterium]|jgi:predicted  nucleic acid-binding Zn-ribbon protein|nr:hypothetical protein [Bacillales bacterium]